MSDFDTKEAFAGLRSAVRNSITPPPAAGVRARAERQLRQRRLVTAGLVGAAVVAVLLGTTTALRPTATPAPPGETPSPTVTQDTAPPRPPLPEPRPDLPIPERPVTTPDDPITAVDWANVTLTVPPRDGCPAGNLRFVDGRTEGWPQLRLMLENDLPGRHVAYGDVTGDGAAEAVIEAGCLLTQEADHIITALLVITRDNDGTLRTIGGWVGPVEWLVHRDIWVQDGRILTEQQWSTPGYEWAPGAAAAYHWDGDSFELVPSGLTPVTVEVGVLEGPPIDLGPDDGYVARSLGCPGGIVHFGQSGGVVYAPDVPLGPSPFLADLDGDGRRHVLFGVYCHDADVLGVVAETDGTGLRGQGILVLDRTATGFVAVDIVSVPGSFVADWYVFEPGTLMAWVQPIGGGDSVAERWVWNGQYFQR